MNIGLAFDSRAPIEYMDMRAQELPNRERFVKLTITVLFAAWLLSGCFTNPPDEDASGAGHRDPRTGLCNDATPPPCTPPKD